jgi:hypothetical protein
MTQKLNDLGNASEKALLQAALGQFVVTRISDTDEHTPDPGFVFCAILAEADTVINTAEGNFAVNAFDGASIKAEGVRYGRFTSLTLTSGTVVAYQMIK